jgi:hypothetical protein
MRPHLGVAVQATANAAYDAAGVTTTLNATADTPGKNRKRKVYDDKEEAHSDFMAMLAEKNVGGSWFPSLALELGGCRRLTLVHPGHGR